MGPCWSRKSARATCRSLGRVISWWRNRADDEIDVEGTDEDKGTDKLCSLAERTALSPSALLDERTTASASSTLPPFVRPFSANGGTSVEAIAFAAPPALTMSRVPVLWRLDARAFRS